MKASTKGLLIAGGIAVVGVTIWLLLRPRKNNGHDPLYAPVHSTT